MDKIILKLRLLRKVLPTEQQLDVNSLRSEFNGLHPFLYSIGDTLRPKSEIELECHYDIVYDFSLVSLMDEHKAAAFIIEAEQHITTLLDMMTFILYFDNPCVFDDDEDNMMKQIRMGCIMDTLVRLTEVLLEGNKKAQCAAWVKEHMSKLKSLRMPNTEDSILHRAMPFHNAGSTLRIEPIVRLLVEQGKMDVNVENSDKETPFHILSLTASDTPPTEDMVNVAELLIDNGAHMDSLDKSGNEASHAFSRLFPKWSFNFNLKCLAARAIIKHGVQYENIAPKTQLAFIKSHKRPRLS